MRDHTEDVQPYTVLHCVNCRTTTAPQTTLLVNTIAKTTETSAEAQAGAPGYVAGARSAKSTTTSLSTTAAASTTVVRNPGPMAMFDILDAIKVDDGFAGADAGANTTESGYTTKSGRRPNSYLGTISGAVQGRVTAAVFSIMALASCWHALDV